MGFNHHQNTEFRGLGVSLVGGMLHKLLYLTLHVLPSSLLPSFTVPFNLYPFIVSS